MPDWPDNVPLNIIRESYEEGGPLGAFIRDQTDKGPPKSRLRFTGAVRPVAMSIWPLSKAEVIAFEAWYRDTIAYGALSFAMSHPRTGLMETFAFNDPRRPYSLVEVAAESWELNFSLDHLP